MDECKKDIKEILVAIDLSEYSEAAFTYALTLAGALGANLTLLNVINTRHLEYMDRLGYDFSPEQFINDSEKQREEEIRRDYLSRAGAVPVKLSFRMGIPYEEILAAAKEKEYDLLVIGIKGKSSVADVHFGATAEKVYRRAKCPVVSVRGPKHCAIP